MRTLFHLVLSLLAVLAQAADAQGLSYTLKTEGKVVTLSGIVDGWRDRNPIRDQIHGKQVLILSRAAAESLESAVRFAELIRQENLTTVIDGECGPNCLPMFMGGQQRQWGVRSGQAASVAVLANQGSTSTISGLAVDLLQFYKQRFVPEFSGPLERVVGFEAGKSSFRFVQSAANQGEGEILECSPSRSPACRPFPGRTPLTIGLVTTLTPYPLQAETPGNQAEATGVHVVSPAPVTLLAAPAAPASAPPTAGNTKSALRLANIVLARNVSNEDGPTGIATSFNLEGRMFVYAAFSWDGGKPSGTHTVETRWFRGQELVHRSPRTPSAWDNPPGAAWYALRAAELGVGNYRVEVWLDDALAGSKDFSIRAN